MTYLTKQQFIARFSQDELDDLVRDLGDADATARFEQCVTDAESMINGYVSKRYSVPINNNDAVTRLAADITRFMLWDDAASAAVRERYEDAVKQLNDISTGKANLAGASDASASVNEASTGQVLVSSPTSQLGLEGY